MALIHGYVKDLDLRLPLLGPIKFRDMKTGKQLDGWRIAVRELTAEQRTQIYDDMSTRFADLPPSEEFWKEVQDHGLPIRADRVDVAYDLRGFV